MEVSAAFNQYKQEASSNRIYNMALKKNTHTDSIAVRHEVQILIKGQDIQRQLNCTKIGNTMTKGRQGKTIAHLIRTIAKNEVKLKNADQRQAHTDMLTHNKHTQNAIIKRELSSH